MAHVPYSFESVPYSTEYVTRVTYTFCDIYGPTQLPYKNLPLSIERLKSKSSKKKYNELCWLNVTYTFYFD